MKKTLYSVLAIFGVVFMTPVLAQNAFSIVATSHSAPLLTSLSTAYMASHPNIHVHVQTRGRVTSRLAVEAGEAELALFDGATSSEETPADLQAKPLAFDALAVVVNPHNGVSNLTTQQLLSIYRGQTTNWKRLGGKDKPIVVISRESVSALRTAFERQLTAKNSPQDKSFTLAKHAQIINDNDVLKHMVTANPYAIGYLPLNRVDASVHALSIDGLSPSSENIHNQTYPLAWPVNWLFKQKLMSPEVQAFLAWGLTPEAQSLVQKHGFFAVKPAEGHSH